MMRFASNQRRRGSRAPRDGAASPPARVAGATSIGISPWSRSRSRISLSLAASSSPTDTAPPGATAL